MNKKKVFFCIVAIALVIALTGCAAVDAFIGKLKGELFGNDYIIRQYDDFGNLVFTVHGDKVTMDCELDEYGEVSSYIDITIDGESWKHVGSTLIHIDGALVYVHRANIDIIPAEFFQQD